MLVEGTLDTRPLDFVERLLAHRPRLVGLGVYIWNASLSLHVVRLLKKLAPEVVVVVGGPEVSHEIEAQPICALADHVVTGEGEEAFRELCRRRLFPRPLDEVPAKLWEGGTPDLATMELPYDAYSDEDLGRRTVYVEASRGCPFRCAFCLSALDKAVRPFPLPAFLDALAALHRRGLRQFKFVDRTFNLAIDDAVAILELFLGLGAHDLFLHFEMIPDRLPDELLAALARFPAGAVQLEVGLQTFDPEVARIIQRRTRFDVAVENIRKLRAETGVHLHADLIAGLPGETWSTFAAGFDRLMVAGPHEIQLGILKRLRGAPLTALPEAAALLFDEEPPYEVLRTPTMTAEELWRLRRVARVLDLVVNQGKLPRAASLLVEQWARAGSVFAGLVQLTDEIFAAEGAVHGVPLLRMAEHVHRHLLTMSADAEAVHLAIEADYGDGGRRRTPPFLVGRTGPPPRQQRHLRGRATPSRPPLPATEQRDVSDL